jgi:hypothetical protein
MSSTGAHRAASHRPGLDRVHRAAPGARTGRTGTGRPRARRGPPPADSHGR